MKVLQQIRKFYFKEAPLYKSLTFEPYTKEEIKSLEETLGFVLHKDLIEFLTNCDFRLDFEGAFSYEGKQTIERNWNVLNNLISSNSFKGYRKDMIDNGFENWQDKKIGPYYCSIKWIPIACDGGGNLICVDHDPGKNGIEGQVLNMEFQDGQGPYFCSFSLTQYLEKHYKSLIDGRWTTWDYGEEGKELIEIL